MNYIKLSYKIHGQSVLFNKTITHTHTNTQETQICTVNPLENDSHFQYGSQVIPVTLYALIDNKLRRHY